jgi:hypothetical protein
MSRRNALTPENVEQVSIFDVPKYLASMKATYAPERSTPSRQIYWKAKGRSKTDGNWILVTAKGGVATLAYYPMEKCPCEDN